MQTLHFSNRLQTSGKMFIRSRNSRTQKPKFSCIILLSNLFIQNNQLEKRRKNIRTVNCRNWEEDRTCKNGSNCIFIDQISELMSINLKNLIEQTSKQIIKEMNSFEKVKNPTSDNCCICLCLPYSEKINCESSVNHMVCSECFNQLFIVEKQKNCPFCRTKILYK